VRVGAGGRTHLTYCLNIHPGERWEDQRGAIERWSAAVKERVSPDSPFGLGLRLGNSAAGSLADPAARRDVRRWLDALGMYVFTVNAFPYGAFHGTTVKEAVYAPDWRTPARLSYTVAVARVLADLLPDGVAGSISTVPGSYRRWIVREGGVPDMVANLAEAAWAMAAIEAETGRTIAIALEPEPDCFLSRTGECIEFWKEVMIPQGTAFLRSRAGSVDRAESCLRRHLGVCVDTCHFAVEFESAEAAVNSFAGAGIAVPKVQLSAALRGPATAEVVRRLRQFVDGVYLHQTRVRRADGSVECWPDMTAESLEALPTDLSGEVRSHFHVPVRSAGNAVGWGGAGGGLASTAGDLTPALFAAVERAGCRHLEIETYTYDVLPPELRAATVAESIVGEYTAVLAMLDGVEQPHGGCGQMFSA
jgi:hypothetical protein